MAVVQRDDTAAQAAQLLRLMAAPQPVSYTHLDVLRFEPLDRAAALELLARVRVFEGRGVELTFRFQPPDAGKQ